MMRHEDTKALVLGNLSSCLMILRETMNRMWERKDGITFIGKKLLFFIVTLY